MDELLIKALGSMGGAALGFMIAWIVYQDNKTLRQENNALRDKILTAFIGEAEIKVRHEQALTAVAKGVQDLIDYVKPRLH